MFSLFRKDSPFVKIVRSCAREGTALLQTACVGDFAIGMEYFAGLLFVLCDLKAFEKGSDRDALLRVFLQDVLQQKKFSGAKFEEVCDSFEKIVAYYEPFIHGKTPLMWYDMGGALRELPKTPVTSCIGAFLDVFYNPSIKVRGYDGAEVPIYNIFSAASFAMETALPFTKLTLKFYNDVSSVLP